MSVPRGASDPRVGPSRASVRSGFSSTYYRSLQCFRVEVLLDSGKTRFPIVAGVNDDAARIIAKNLYFGTHRVLWVGGVLALHPTAIHTTVTP